jgi:hypothetical protein
MNSHSEFDRAGKAVAMVVLPILVAIAPFSPRLDGNLSKPACAAPAHGAKGKQAPKEFEYTVSDCQGSDKKDSVGLEVSESSVRFNQILTMNCIAATHPNTVKVSYSKKGRDLQVSVILRSDVLSDCTCPIGIEGEIFKLGKGDYRISFIYDYKPGSTANEKPVRQALGSKEFSIK